MGIVSGLLSAVAGNAALGWLARRGGEALSFGLGAGAIVAGLPSPYQQLIFDILAGRGGEASIGVYLGFAGWLLTQWRSWRATVNPHVVDANKHRRVLTEAEARAETGYYGPIEDRTR